MQRPALGLRASAAGCCCVGEFSPVGLCVGWGGPVAAAEVGSLAGGLGLGRRGLFLRAVGLVIKAPTLGRPIAVFVANHVLNGFLPNGVQMLLHGFFHEWIPPDL